MTPPVPERPTPEAARPAAPPPKGPPMSSRAVLMVGGLTLLCLSMAAAMAFQTDPAEAPPSLDAVPAMEATPVADA
ncbi:MAG TPA: hypothetical protein VK610_05520, partial [Rhodothermales bacterium]|nr:hypothetical protein [Rhodothermales bacterium]